MTKKLDGTEKKLIVDTKSLVTKIPPDKEIVKGRKILTETKKIRTLTETKLNSLERLR